MTEEYQKLDEVGCDQSKEAGRQDIVRRKNRYKNIVPYDNSRVKLTKVQGDPASDYINASFVSGINSEKEYIATQAPVTASKRDFWRMIWEQECKNIVMLTQIEESGKKKSIQYWPDENQTMKIKDFKLETISFNETASCTVRLLKLIKNENERTVRHFHFKAWFDKSVPENAKDLIKFVLKVRKTIDNEDQGIPLVVHCSAGVGRTGTFIAIDQLLQKLYLQDRIDVYGQVHQLRMQRCYMVQTKAQYSFIHKAIENYLNNTDEYENPSQAEEGYVNAVYENVTIKSKEPTYRNVLS